MGFFGSRVSFGRFRVSGKTVKLFGPEHIEKLEAFAIGKSRVASGDGIDAGWTAGDHILDTRFDLAKNIVNDTLQFALRIDQQKVPADLLRAYTAVELEGMAAGNPSGLPSARQRREARANAKDKLETEAGDGRFLRRKAYPLLWDARTQELLVANTGVTVVDRLHTLFQKAFGRTIEPLGAGRQAFLLAEARQQTRGIDDAAPSPFVPNVTPSEMAWAPDEANRDFLGNEFLLWLWYLLDSETDTVKLEDGSEVAVMLARSLTLECPRGQTGKESITSDGPTRLPEVRQAIQSGKLPRKVGLTLVRHDRHYELMLQAETLAVTGAKLPAPEDETGEERARLEERVDILRHFLETLDLLYNVFGSLRMGENWRKELVKIQKWLQREDRSHKGDK